MTTAVLVPWDESQPLESLIVASISISSLIHATDTINVVSTLVIRPTANEAGLYAHHYSCRTTSTTSTTCTIGDKDEENFQQPNIRATRLAMACGLFGFRLRGNVLLTRGTLGCTSGGILLLEDVLGACNVSCDLRWIQPLPDWLGNAAHQNYHDALVISRLAAVMNRSSHLDSDQSDTDVDDSDDDQECKGALTDSSNNRRSVRRNEMVTTVPLCLHCRKPATQLCPDCQGAYFCDPPALCRLEG
jgi:hypothetical protein